jgi:hypothetical protein
MKGKEIAIFYDDGQSVVRRDGTLIEEHNDWVFILVNGKTMSIPKSRVVRIEFKEDVTP